jgi:WD40 repeat protein
MLIWSLSVEIYRFKILLKDKGMDRICLHTQPIELVTYLDNLEKVLSYDSSKKAVVWDINTLSKCQVIVFEQSVKQFFPFKSSPSVLVLGSETFILEKIRLSDHFGEFLLFEVVFDFSLKRFLVLTNQEIRYLDYIDGGLQKISIHNCRNLILQEKFLEVIKTSQGHNYILGLNENQQFSLYNLNTLEKIRDVHLKNETHNENPSCIFFINELDLLAVGYEESKIKGRSPK